MKVYLAVVLAGLALPLSVIGFGLGLNRPGPAGKLTCAEVERVLPAMAASNGGVLGAVTCKRVKEIADDSYVVDANIVQGGETRFWTFQVTRNGWLVTHAEQTGSRVVKPPPAA